jgi:predicted MFS family arabinose efflux permease
MEIGLGLLLVYFCFLKDGLKNGLIVLAFSIGVTALSRLYGIVFDQGGDMSNVISFIVEFAFALMAIILFLAEKKSERRLPASL